MSHFESAGTSRFAILRRVGAGGMGVVYEAIDHERGQRVALKTIPAPSGKALLRLKNEFRSLQDIHHPNLVRLEELVEEQGQWFFTMELIEGIDFLRFVCRGTPAQAAMGTLPGGLDETLDPVTPEHRERLASARVFDEERLRSALAQLASGLCALHAAGKVHRDVKPTNVLVDREGRLVLLDMGLITESRPERQSSEAHLVGTIAYMAPEQAMARAVGPAADWYAVGVMLYEALTGRLPFVGQGLEILAHKQAREPTPPAALRADIPDDLGALCVELLRTDPSARPSGDQVLERLGTGASEAPASPPIALERAVSALVGRQDELAALRAAFAHTRDGETVVLLIRGQSGVGKSALVRHFIDDLARRGTGAVVLSGRCYERESVPYKAFDGVIDSLSRFMASLDDARAGALLPRAASLLGQVFPVLCRVRMIRDAPDPQTHRSLDPRELRSRLLSAVRELFLRLTDRYPVVITIDDLQWADRDSCALMGELLRQPDGPRFLLLMTMRPLPEDSPLAEMLPPRMRIMELECLAQKDARALARLLLDDAADDETANAIAREAEGHPLFIDELVRNRALRGDDADTAIRLDDALLARIRTLPRPAQLLLELVVVASAPVERRIAAACVDMAADALADAIASLRAQRLLRSVRADAPDVVIEPYHDRIREALLGALSQAEQEAHHRALAEAFESARPKADPEVLAVHWQGAGEALVAARYAIEAAANAESALAFDHAARLYSKVFRLDPAQRESAALHLKHGHALANAGRGPEAAARYLALVPSADAEAAREHKRLAAEQYLRSGYFDRGLEVTRDVLGSLGIRMPRSRASALLSTLYLYLRFRLRGIRYRRREPDEVAPEMLARIDFSWSLALTVSACDTWYGPVLNAQALLIALRSGEPRRIARSLAFSATWAALPRGRDQGRAAKLLGVAGDLAEETRDHESIAWVALFRGMSSWVAGRFRKALAETRDAARIFRDRCVGKFWEVTAAHYWELKALFHLGEIAELEQRVSLLRREAEERNDLLAMSFVCMGVANVGSWLIRDAPDDALEESRAILRRWSRAGFHVQHWSGLTVEVECALYAEDGARALASLDAAWPALKKSLLLHILMFRTEAYHARARSALSAARILAPGQRRTGLVHLARRDAARLLREKHRWCEPLGLLLDAGVALLQREPERAKKQLEDAARGFDTLDMTLHAAATRHRLGELIGGDSGGELCAASRACLQAQRIREPGRWVAMLAPVPGDHR